MTTPTLPLDCDGFAVVLADYLVGDAADGVRAAVEAHAGSCAACQQLLTDLNTVRVEAAALPLLMPSRDLWSGIAERIDARVLSLDASRTARDIPRRPAWLRPAIAAAALMVFTAGATYYITRASLSSAASTDVTASVPTAPKKVAVVPAPEPAAPIVPTVSAAPSPATPTRLVSSPAKARPVNITPDVAAGDPVFASEIGKLRKIVRERRSQLDPKTVAVLEQSIAVIDSAIAQSRAALAKDPASGFLVTQLNHSLEKKVELLRTAALLPART